LNSNVNIFLLSVHLRNFLEYIAAACWVCLFCGCCWKRFFRRIFLSERIPEDRRWWKWFKKYFVVVIIVTCTLIVPRYRLNV